MRTIMASSGLARMRFSPLWPMAMGGHASGEIASRMAVEIIQEVYSKERMEQDVLDALKSAFEVANFSILQKSLEQDE